jgi:hypothetical protein
MKPFVPRSRVGWAVVVVVLIISGIWSTNHPTDAPSRPASSAFGGRQSSPTPVRSPVSSAATRRSAPSTPIPDVYGLPESAARRVLSRSGYVPISVSEPSRSEAGTVVATVPAAGTPAERDTSVLMYIAAADVPGITAVCRDGTLSFSLHASATCSSQGGVAHWVNHPG